MRGPTLPISIEIQREKHRLPGEDFREGVNRVCGALKDGDEHYRALRDIVGDNRFLFGGRIQRAMGSLQGVTAYNCFVSGTIEDSFVDGQGSIMERAKQAAATMRRGGGIGYDFSTLRPAGSLIKKLGSRSSGPLPFMNIFDSVCGTVQSAGHRRGAQMGVMRVDHPDIEAFIKAKQNDTAFRNFNLSIAVTDEFMNALLSGEMFKLRWGGEVYREIDPAVLWEQIMRSTWDWAEPGVLFIDQINRMNNLAYCETIAATNPCGEQPLPPFGACLLGSFNLTRYVYRSGTSNAWSFDFDELRADIPQIVRAMDNVVDRTVYPLFEQEKEAQDKRRMGIGVTGVANALEACGMPYGTPEFRRGLGEVLATINTGAYEAGVDLAKEKGAFPLFEADGYLDDTFADSRLPDSLKDQIARHGVRNSHYTSIAPTGTISLAADNVSSGIEPVFSYGYDRTINMPDGQRVEHVSDYGVREFDVKGVRSQDVSAHEHVTVLAEATKWVDSAVSKTCNVSPDMPWDDFKAIYEDAWRMGCKGCTTFNPGGKRFGILNVSEDNDVEEGAACYVDEAGNRTCE